VSRKEDERCGIHLTICQQVGWKNAVTEGLTGGVNGETTDSARSGVAARSSSTTCTHEQRNGVRWHQTWQRDDTLAHWREEEVA
jgi:hypothetical protein